MQKLPGKRKKNALLTDRSTDRSMDRPMDQPMDQRTDTVGYRVTCTRLKYFSLQKRSRCSELQQQGQIHGHRCVRLCYLVNSGGAFVHVSVHLRERVCVRLHYLVDFARALRSRALLVRSAALIRSFTRLPFHSFPSSWERGFCL